MHGPKRFPAWSLLLVLTVSCTPAFTSSLGETVCPPKPVGLAFEFASETSAEDRAVIREALTNAREYFPLEFEPEAVYSQDSQRYQCLPADQVETISTTVTHAGGGEDGLYLRGRVRIYINDDWGSGSPWLYRLAMHEAYHMYQSLSTRAHSSTISPPSALWMSEGSAVWAAYDGAVHFGHYASMDEARRVEAGRKVHDRSDLRTFESRVEFDAYPLYFEAVDYLLSHHGGRQALRRYWEMDVEDVDWREIFRRAFGISVQDFYDEFAYG